MARDKRSCSRYATHDCKQAMADCFPDFRLADVNKVTGSIGFGGTRLERGDIFRKSGFRSNFAIPIGISGFIFSTTSNHENPA
jgi:hypothetical protein